MFASSIPDRLCLVLCTFNFRIDGIPDGIWPYQLPLSATCLSFCLLRNNATGTQSYSAAVNGAFAHVNGMKLWHVNVCWISVVISPIVSLETILISFFFCSSFAWSWCYCFVIFVFCLFSSSSLLSSLCGHCLLYWNLRVFVNRFQMKLFVDDAIIVGRRSGARACHTYMRAMQMLSNPPLIQLVIINRKPALSFWFKKTNFVNDPVLYVIC